MHIEKNIGREELIIFTMIYSTELLLFSRCTIKSKILRCVSSDANKFKVFPRKCTNINKNI